MQPPQHCPWLPLAFWGCLHPHCPGLAPQSLRAVLHEAARWLHPHVAVARPLQVVAAAARQAQAALRSLAPLAATAVQTSISTAVVLEGFMRLACVAAAEPWLAEVVAARQAPAALRSLTPLAPTAEGQQAQCAELASPTSDLCL